MSKKDMKTLIKAYRMLNKFEDDLDEIGISLRDSNDNNAANALDLLYELIERNCYFYKQLKSNEKKGYDGLSEMLSDILNSNISIDQTYTFLTDKTTIDLDVYKIIAEQEKELWNEKP